MYLSKVKQKRLVFETPLDKEMLKKRLSAITDESNFHMSDVSQPKTILLEGKIGDESFEVSTKLEYFNFARPIICGYINELEDGSQIDLKIEMDTLFMVFVAIWLGIALLSCLGTIIYLFITGNFSFFQLIPFLWVLFGGSVFRKGIEDEERRISKILRDTIQAKVV